MSHNSKALFSVRRARKNGRSKNKRIFDRVSAACQRHKRVARVPSERPSCPILVAKTIRQHSSRCMAVRRLLPVIVIHSVFL